MSTALLHCYICNGTSALSACGRSKQGAETQGNAPEVAVVVVQPERITVVTELPGRTSAYLVAEVRPQVSGIIQKRFFTEGLMLRQVMCSIRSILLPMMQHTAAKAALARSEANVVSIKSRVERYKELVTINAVSQQEFDDASAALKQAEADVQVNKAATETARINL